MRWHYDLAGAEPIIRDVPVYDASTLVEGELLALGTTDPDSNADQGVAFVSAGTSTADLLGIANETITSGMDNKPVEGSAFIKAVINPLAVYLAEYSQAAADDVAITTGGSSTTVTVTSLEDDIDAGWVYFPLASGGAAGNLRFITAAASGSCTVDSAVTTTTSDTLIKILPVNHRATTLNTAATKIKSQAAAGSAASLHIMENYINSTKRFNMEPLRYGSHAGLSGLDSDNVKFYADVCIIDHVYNIT